MEPLYHVCVFGPQLLQLFRGMLERCFVLRHQKCFVGHKTSPNSIDGESIKTEC